jgi:membrane-bound lytic murein transglycosylase D
MLQKKRVRAQFLSHGLLLIIPSTTIKNSAETLTRSAENKMAHPSGQRFQGRDTSIAILSRDSSGISDVSVSTEPAAAISDEPKIHLTKHSSSFVKHYLKTEGESLTKIRQRSERYFAIIDSVFRKYHLPLELKYLAVIESELKPDARSHMGAIGAWQFMPTTARELGLKVSRKRDERTYFYKSTVAAAKYLKALYAEFGDWLLVIAAYNSGPGPIYRAIHKSGSRNFWVLQRYLPAESRGHVKRFIGAHYFFEGNEEIAGQNNVQTAAYKTVIHVSK